MPLITTLLLLTAAVATGDSPGSAFDPAPVEQESRPEIQHQPLKAGVLLIARQGLPDANFGRSVILITYYDKECFRLESGKTSLLTNPVNNRLKADVTIYTRSSLSDQVFFSPGEMAIPGEYEIGGIMISGLQISPKGEQKNVFTAYAIGWENTRIIFLGNAFTDLRLERFPGSIEQHLIQHGAQPPAPGCEQIYRHLPGSG